MESAGKRIIREPKRFTDYIVESHKPKMSTTTATSTTTTTTITTTSIPTSNFPSSNINTIVNQQTSGSSEISFRQMMNEMMEENRRCHADTKAELRQHTTDQVAQCMQVWQLADVRLSKLEDDNLHQVSLNLKQETTNIQVSSRLTTLEDDVVSVREDLARIAALYRSPNHTDISRVFPPTSLSSTTISTTRTTTSISQPLTSCLLSSSIPPGPPPLSLYDPSRSSLFGSQERLQEAVANFSGNIKAVHPEKFINQLDTYFANVSLTSTQQLISVQRRLSDDAQTWFESLIPSPTDYEEFRIVFRQRYWSSATQRKIRNEIFRPFQYRSSTGIATHAMGWIAKAKYLTPPVDQLDLVGIIIQHFPSTLGMAVRGRGPRSTNELLAVLTEFEESTSFCDTHNSRSHENPVTGQGQNRTFNERTGQQPNHGNRQGYNRGGYNRGGYNRDAQQTHQLNNQSANPGSAAVNQINTSGNDEETRQ